MKTIIETINESRALDKSLLKRYEKELNVSLKDWYHANYKSDPMWEEIEDCPMSVFLSDLIDGTDIYPKIGQDSIVRERVFNGLAKILKVSYSKIYDAWSEKYY